MSSLVIWPLLASEENTFEELRDLCTCQYDGCHQWSRNCISIRTTRVHLRSIVGFVLLDLYCFMCGVLWIIVCPFSFGRWFVLSVLLFTTTNYPLGIFNLFLTLSLVWSVSTVQSNSNTHHQSLRIIHKNPDYLWLYLRCFISKISHDCPKSPTTAQNRLLISKIVWQLNTTVLILDLCVSELFVSTKHLLNATKPNYTDFFYRLHVEHIQQSLLLLRHQTRMSFLDWR